MSIRTIQVGILLLAGAFTAWGKVDFSGEWVMNAAKSDFGQIPAPEKYLRTVEHKDPNITVNTEQEGQQGAVKNTTSYTTDGKEFTVKSNRGEMKGTAGWEADTLVVRTTREVQGITFKQEDKWNLATDGKSMTIDSVVSTPKGDFKIKVTFEKK